MEGVVRRVGFFKQVIGWGKGVGDVMGRLIGWMGLMGE